MDFGICPGNYFDYFDDDVARQRELELFDTWNGPGSFIGKNCFRLSMLGPIIHSIVR